MSDKDDDNQHYEGVLLEEIREQNKIILEAVAALKDLPKDVREIKEDVAELKSDMRAVKAAVTDQTRQLTDHELRITTLEQAA